METTIFRPLPLALIERLKTHVKALRGAKDKPAQLAAIFLIHCECKDALKRIEAMPDFHKP